MMVGKVVKYKLKGAVAQAPTKRPELFSRKALQLWSFALGSLSERQPPAPLVEQKCFSYKIRAKRDDKKIIVLEDALYDTERDAGTGSGTEKYRTFFCRGKGHHREKTDPLNK